MHVINKFIMIHIERRWMCAMQALLAAAALIATLVVFIMKKVRPQ